MRDIYKRCLPLIALLAGANCSTHRLPAHDAWWSEPREASTCSASVLPPFAEVSTRQFARVAQRLESANLVLVPRAEATELSSGKIRSEAFLVRALVTEPADGQMTVTSCGTTLFLSYVAPPTHMHRGTRRSALLVVLPVVPEQVAINAAEGIP
jgi:hypothetical protein